VSVAILEVSADILEADVSIVAGATVVVESTVFKVLSVVVVSVVEALSLQATKAPIAKTNKSFFMLKFLFVKNLYPLILKV
jgi:hypothetical protein